MNTKITSGLAAAALAAGLAGAATPAAAQDIYVGYQLPLTGSQSHYGEVFRNAATMQLEKFNAAGGVAGNRIRNVLPLPGALSSVTVPPCATTMDRVM